MRALLSSPFGFLIGILLGALGGGGSILAVPVLVFIAGLEPAEATTTSLIVVGLASLLGAYDHARAGRVRVNLGVTFGLTGLLGSVAGSIVNDRMSGDILLLAFAGLMLVAAWRIAVGCPSCTRSGEASAIASKQDETPRVDRFTLSPKIVAAGTIVGFLTGLFGVGGGFIIVPALTLFLAVPIDVAVGTSLLVIAVNAASALVARVGVGSIDWAVTALFTAAAVAGVHLGKRIADRVETTALQRWFAVMLVALSIYTGVNAMLGL